ncbi:hypothetical protein BACCOPRO_03384 [Phocaeicola coprophilus DSM 18228 = JCM 13818]|uniref:Uncharacterized protein n=1 Tax=Phocaeicola coprophilus DSM 18228 = JCM 13818 TaxID=547042 RepID=S0FEL5_9BACT|nr:hypothetical protein BACCOPRO_03384 [Phocaeicola coprophilus DSM 18228 = JCM 13818]
MHQLGRIGQQTYCAVLFADVKSQKGKVFFSALSIAVDAGDSFSLPVKDQDFIPAQHKEMIERIAELADIRYKEVAGCVQWNGFNPGKKI